jgi:hypothetical protein
VYCNPAKGEHSAAVPRRRGCELLPPPAPTHTPSTRSSCPVELIRPAPTPPLRPALAQFGEDILDRLAAAGPAGVPRREPDGFEWAMVEADFRRRAELPTRDFAAAVRRRLAGDGEGGGGGGALARVLCVHGREDTTVPPEESQAGAAAPAPPAPPPPPPVRAGCLGGAGRGVRAARGWLAAAGARSKGVLAGRGGAGCARGVTRSFVQECATEDRKEHARERTCLGAGCAAWEGRGARLLHLPPSPPPPPPCLNPPLRSLPAHGRRRKGQRTHGGCAAPAPTLRGLRCPLETRGASDGGGMIRRRECRFAAECRSRPAPPRPSRAAGGREGERGGRRE